MAASNFDVLKKLSNENKEIALSTTLVSTTTVKAGGHVVMGVDRNWLNKLTLSALDAGPEYVAALIIYKRDDFDEAKAELEAAEKPKPVATSLEGCPFMYCDRNPHCEGKCRYNDKEPVVSA